MTRAYLFPGAEGPVGMMSPHQLDVFPLKPNSPTFSPHHLVAKPFSTNPTPPPTTGSFRQTPTPILQPLIKVPDSRITASSSATPAGPSKLPHPLSANAINNEAGSNQPHSKYQAISGTSSENQEDDCQISLAQAQKLGKARIRLIPCPWQGQPGCDAELASFSLCKKHLETVHLPRAKRSAAARLSRATTARAINLVRCDWVQCGLQYPVAELERHVERDHLSPLEAYCPFKTCTKSLLGNVQCRPQDHPPPWTLASLRSHTYPHSGDLVAPCTLTPIAIDTLAVIPPFLASPVEPYRRPEDSSVTSLLMRRSGSSRSSQGQLLDRKDCIGPNRDETTPFWATQGEATAGYRSSVATSSSIFPHPWYHNPLHRVDYNEQKLGRLLAAGRTRPGGGEIEAMGTAMLSGEREGKDEDGSPFDSLRPPGTPIDDTPGTRIVMLSVPEKIRFPPIIVPVDIHVPQRRAARVLERMSHAWTLETSDTKGRTEAMERDAKMEVDVEEKPVMFSAERVNRAANRYAAKIAGHTIGQGIHADRRGFLQEKVRFERIGRELGMMAPRV